MGGRELVERAVELGLVDAGELPAILEFAAEQNDDANEVARRLVQAGRLTKYQAAAIYQGESRSLVYGDYVVVDRIGAGSMGQVFQARHRDTGHVVAIKAISTAKLSVADGARRFEREVKAATRLVHPNIVRAFDAGVQDGRRYLVMDFIDGPDLSTLLKRQGPLPIREACDYVAQAARGIGFAHGEGIVHRDVKPGNLLVDRDGTVKVLDLGVARFDDVDEAEGELTQDGAVLGTVDYMAPEQALNTRLADARSDVYGLGCTLYRLLTGRVPYGGATTVEKILAHRNHPIPMLRQSRPDAPAELEQLLFAMLDKRPEQRPAMQAVAERLATIDVTPTQRSAGEGQPPLPPPIASPVAFAGTAEPAYLYPPAAPLPPAAVSRPMMAPSTASSRAGRGIAASRRRPRPLLPTLILVVLGSFAGVYVGYRFFMRTGDDPLVAKAAEADGGDEIGSTSGLSTKIEPTRTEPPGTGPTGTVAPGVVEPDSVTPAALKSDTSTASVPRPSSPTPGTPTAGSPSPTQPKHVTPTPSSSGPRSSVPRAPAVATGAPAGKSPTPSPTAPAQPPKPSLRETRRAAIDSGLEWLAQCQQPQGNWTFAVGPDGPQNSDYDNSHAATGLALLAFLRAGHAPRVGPYGKEIDKGLLYLLNKQERTGKGNTVAGNWWNRDKGNMYTHAIATLAMIEAAKATTLKDARYLSAARLAVRFIVFAQDRNGGGWRYNPGEPGDLSVTGWQVQALRGFLNLKNPNEPMTDTIEKSLAAVEKGYLPTVQINDGRRYRYMNEGKFSDNASMSAAGLSTVLELGASSESTLIREGAERLLVDPPADLPYQNYYKTRLLRQIGGDKWSVWDDRITRDLAAKQQKAPEPNLRGSWKPNPDELVGKSGGRFAMTTFNLLILLVGKEDDPPP